MNHYKSSRAFRTISLVRPGQVTVTLALLLPAILGILGLAFDGGLVMVAARKTQNVADSAALAAATQLRLGNGLEAATMAAEDEVWVQNGLTGATVVVHSPPHSGPYAGLANYVELLVQQSADVALMHILSCQRTIEVQSRAVAGYVPSTAGAAVVVLDPDPAPLAVGPLSLPLPALPTLVGGLEILGTGDVEVHAAVLVNTQWGGVDESGEPAGDAPGPPHGVACTPLLSLNKLRAEDLRVVGGVDRESNYAGVDLDDPTPLRANRLAVPDPFKALPVPTVASDPVNTSLTEYGGVAVTGLPIGPPITLSPGVYDWIDVVSGQVIFEPGIYIIRSQHPVTHQSLTLIAGSVRAEGVMFYLTDSAAYSPTSGLPDALDGESTPPPALAQLVPSAIINIGLPGSSFTPLNSPGSPFHGMMLYQRRRDRRPIVVVQQDLLGGGNLRGTVYAKWGHVILAGRGAYDAHFVAGTMRMIAISNMQIAPSELLPSAEDVFLFE